MTGAPATAGAAAALISELTDARVIDLEQPRFAGMPMFPANAPNYTFMLHRRHEAGAGEPDQRGRDDPDR